MTSVVSLHLSGESADTITEMTGIAKQTIYNYIAEGTKEITRMLTEKERMINVSPDRHIKMEGKDSEIVQQCYEYAINLEQYVPIQEVRDRFNMNVTMQRKFKKRYGVTLYNVIRETLLERARKLILCYDATISEVRLMAGFCHNSAFTESYRNYFGIAPMVDKKRQKHFKQKIS
jgi:transcriptional regulator GlxA family with amidase domain